VRRLPTADSIVEIGRKVGHELILRFRESMSNCTVLRCTGSSVARRVAEYCGVLRNVATRTPQRARRKAPNGTGSVVNARLITLSLRRPSAF